MSFGNYDTLTVYQLLLRNLFFPITRGRFNIYFHFFGNVTLNAGLKSSHGANVKYI